MVLDGQGRPACVIETVSVVIQRFDRWTKPSRWRREGPYEAWRDGHIAYFERNGGYRPDMLLACERFRVVEVFER